MGKRICFFLFTFRCVSLRKKNKQNRNYRCPFITIHYLPSPLPNQYSITFRHQILSNKKQSYGNTVYGYLYVVDTTKTSILQCYIQLSPHFFLVPFYLRNCPCAPKSILIEAIETDYTTKIKSLKMFM